jgi:hypothetical protein
MATTYDFPDHIKGDTMEAVTFTITVNAVALNLTGASARMDVRESLKGKQLVRYTSAVSGGLTIVAPATDGKLRFDEAIIDLPVGTHNYDIEITLADASVKTYISGTWTIVQDITYGA